MTVMACVVGEKTLNPINVPNINTRQYRRTFVVSRTVVLLLLVRVVLSFCCVFFHYSKLIQLYCAVYKKIQNVTSGFF